MKAIKGLHQGCTNCGPCPEIVRPAKQGRREKFRPSGQKFRLGPLVSGAPKSRDEQKKVIASADVQISAQHLVMSKVRS